MAIININEMQQQLRDKKLSSRELTQHLLTQIEQHHDLNCFITVTPELALAQADEADKRLAQGDDAPLLGIPLAHKDIFCTLGQPTTCGSKMLANYIPPYDATVVTKLQQAGMVCLGKTNMDEFAMGSSNETSYFGPVLNPWDKTRVPGGSSGGSAAAVAAGLTSIATGTDTGGSIRQPAAFCGVTGIKPTYGRVSRWGMVAFASSLDQAGVFTRSAADAALVLRAMAGHDPRDSTAARHDVPNYTNDLNAELTTKTIGLPKELFTELDPSMSRVLDNAIETYQKLGVSFKEIELPHSQYAIAVYYIITPSECSSNLARYDGIRFGYRADNPEDLNDLYIKTRSEGFGDEVKRRILIGTYTLSAGYFDAYYLQAKKVRQLIANDFQQAFSDVDLILCPTTPSVAFKIGEKTQDPISMYYSDLYTIAANLAGLPAMSLPGGFIDGLPCGFQLIANHFQESALLQAAHHFQQVSDWHQQSPTEL